MANSVPHSPKKPHFFQPLLPGFHSQLSIPLKFFSEHKEGRYEKNTVELRSDACENTWKVKMEGRRLTVGWKEFTIAHDFRVGDIIIFRHEGDLVFHVTSFGPSCCEIQYVQDNIGNLATKQNLETEPETSSSDQPCFVARVTDSNLREDTVFLPKKFAWFDGLNKGSTEISLTTDKVRTWTLILKFRESTRTFYMTAGWRSFCRENRLQPGDSLTFKLERNNTRTPFLRLSTSELKRRSKKYSSQGKREKTGNSSTEQNLKIEPEFPSGGSCFEALITDSNLREDRLFLPRRFVTSNSLKKGSSKIIIITNDGERRWTFDLLFRKSSETFYIRPGWRSFCHENGLEPGDLVTFKLERNKRRTPLLRFCAAESKSVSTKHSSKRKRKTGETRFVTLRATPACLKYCRIYLPMRFTRGKGMEKAGGKKITLLDKHGVEWPVNLVIAKGNRRLHLGLGLREFLMAIGVKANGVFTLELVWDDATIPPIFKFCSEIKTRL